MRAARTRDIMKIILLTFALLISNPALATGFKNTNDFNAFLQSNSKEEIQTKAEHDSPLHRAALAYLIWTREISIEGDPFEAAAQKFKECANQNIGFCHYWYGKYLEIGAVDDQLKKAYEHYQLAGDLGFSPGYVKMAWIHGNGSLFDDTFPINQPLAVKYLNKAIEMDPYTGYFAAFMFYIEVSDTKLSEEELLELLKSAADAGNPSAIEMLNQIRTNNGG